MATIFGDQTISAETDGTLNHDKRNKIIMELQSRIIEI
jgi:hypothetical protein